MPDESTISNEQMAMMDDLDYIEAEDEGTNQPEEDVTKPEGEVKEPEVKPEAKPEVKPEGEIKEEKKEEPVKESPDEERLRLYKEQVAHYQKLYEKEQKEKEELVKSVKKEEAPAQGPRVLSQDELTRHYAPEIQATVEKGYLSEEFVSSFPTEAVQMVYHRDIIQALVKRVSELVALSNQGYSQSQTSQMDARIGGLFSGLAKKGGFYESLAEPDVQAKFKTYLIDLNPFTDQLTEEFLDRQWLAFNREAILEAARIAAGGSPRPPSGGGNAKGEGGGNRPKKQTSSQETRPWDDL